MKSTHPILLAPPDWEQICNRMGERERPSIVGLFVLVGLVATWVAFMGCAVYGAWMLFCKLKGWL